MLDYTKYMKNPYRFILNYEVVDNNIIVHYANLDDYIVPYSKESEIILLMLMKGQILELTGKMQSLREKYKNYDNFPIKFFSSVGVLYQLIEQNLLVLAFSFGLIGVSIFQKRAHDKLGIILDDYDKNKFFLDNEEKFKEYGRNIDINQVDKYTKEELLLMLCYEEDTTTLKRF